MDRDALLLKDMLADAIAESLPEFWYVYADRNPAALRLHFEGAEGVSFELAHAAQGFYPNFPAWLFYGVS